MFETPGVIIMTIAATRMHRSLVNFASLDVYGPSLLCFSPAQCSLCHFRIHESPKTSNSVAALAFPKTKRTDAPSTVPDRVEVADFELHMTGSTNDSESSTIISISK